MDEEEREDKDPEVWVRSREGEDEDENESEAEGEDEGEDEDEDEGEERDRMKHGLQYLDYRIKFFESLIRDWARMGLANGAEVPCTQAEMNMEIGMEELRRKLYGDGSVPTAEDDAMDID